MTGILSRPGCQQSLASGEIKNDDEQREWNQCEHISCRSASQRICLAECVDCLIEAGHSRNTGQKRDDDSSDRAPSDVTRSHQHSRTLVPFGNELIPGEILARVLARY